MTVKYYAILTNQGAARLANATMLGSKLNLTQMAVGDANGVLPTPDPAQTKLINQKRIAPLNLLSVDPNNQSQIIAEQIIPENEGGFWIREIGLYDDEGVLIAVANCPETYKPQLQEGSGRTQTIRMILVVSNTEAITLKIDPSVVLATRKYVDDEVLELRLYVDDQMRNHIAAQDPHTQYAQKHNPTFTGEPKAPTPAAGNNTTRIATTAFVQAAITALINGAPATLDTLKEIAAAINNDPKFSTTINNALALKAPLSSPALTGTPTAPTAAQSVNNTQIATTAFVKSAIAAMVGSAPAALDTLNELAAALGNDPNFSTTVLNALAGKQPLDNTLTNLSGKDVAGLLAYLGLGEAAKRNVGNGQNQIPDMAAFASSLSSTGFQKLPSGLIIQWGIVSGASNYTVTYPVTFPNRSLALLAVPHTTSVAGISAMGIANCSDISKSQFYIIVGGISQGEIVKHERSCFWVAIGV
ncbi:phage tail protein [Escherichia coli]|nr:phage tail protein [Escherichia coli]